MPASKDVFPDTAPDLAREVLVHGPMERSELGRKLRLSPASLTRLTKPYFDAGLFVEGEDLPRVGSGRRARPIDVAPGGFTFIGLKVTGDDVTAVLTDLRATVLASHHEALTAREPAVVVPQLARIVTMLAQERPVQCVGVSIGGRARDRRRVQEAVYLEWHDVPLAELLEEELAIPVRVENDVVALLAAEHWFGPARAAGSFALLTIGAGVGYGLVIEDSVVVGPDSGLALLGHAPLEPNGSMCPEGHRGCATAMLTMPGICAQVSAVRGLPVTFEEVLQQASAGDVVAARVIEQAAVALGRMLAWIANATGVTTIVLSGEGNGLLAAARSAVMSALEANRLPQSSAIELIVEEPDFIMWARGAAAVAIQDYVVGTVSV